MNRRSRPWRGAGAPRPSPEAGPSEYIPFTCTNCKAINGLVSVYLSAFGSFHQVPGCAVCARRWRTS